MEGWYIDLACRRKIFMNIKAKKNILDNIEIASPCTVSWNNMEGNSTVRNCAQCKLSVYNISEMSKKEGEKLIQENEGRLCIRLYRRFDGTLITNDCPVGLRKIKQSLDFIVRAAAALLSVFLSFTPVKGQDNTSSNNTKRVPSTVLMGKPVAHPNGTNNSNSNRKVLMGKFVAAPKKPVNGTPMMGSPVPQNSTMGLPVIKNTPPGFPQQSPMEKRLMGRYFHPSPDYPPPQPENTNKKRK